MPVLKVLQCFLLHILQIIWKMSLVGIWDNKNVGKFKLPLDSLYYTSINITLNFINIKPLFGIMLKANDYCIFLKAKEFDFCSFPLHPFLIFLSQNTFLINLLLLIFLNFGLISILLKTFSWLFRVYLWWNSREIDYFCQMT